MGTILGLTLGFLPLTSLASGYHYEDNNGVLIAVDNIATTTVISPTPDYASMGGWVIASTIPISTSSVDVESECKTVFSSYDQDLGSLPLSEIEQTIFPNVQCFPFIKTLLLYEPM